MVMDEIIQIEGLKIHHIVDGEGEPIVFLHGWGANTSLITPLSDRLVTLGYKVHVLDLPGFGTSDEPKTAWTVFDYANFVIQYCDTVGLDTFFLFGHSFGGRLGLILGAEHPQRIKKMTLSNSAGIVENKPSSGNMRLKLYKGIRNNLYKVGADNLADSLRDAYNSRYGSSDFNQASGIIREIFVKVVNQDLQDYAKRVSVSTLLFWGDKDEDTPLWYGQRFEELIPDAGLIVHEGAGHYSYLDYAQQTAKIMDHFFKQD